MKQPWAFGILSSVLTIAWVCVGCSSSDAPVVPTLPESPPLSTLIPTLPPSNTPIPTLAPPPTGPVEGQPTEQLRTRFTAESTSTVSASSNSSDNNLHLEETANHTTIVPAEAEQLVAPEGDVLVISGTVLGGGDTSDPDRLGGPRRFEFEVKTDDGQIVLVTYTAFPSRPSGSSKIPEIRLDFHESTIQDGHYLIAHGAYSAATNSLTVAEGGDFIETYPGKP